MFKCFTIISVILISFGSIAIGQEMQEMGTAVAEPMQEQVFESEKGNYTISVPSDWEIKKEFLGMDMIAIAPTEGAEDMFRENGNVLFVDLEETVDLQEFYEKNVTSLEMLLTDFDLEDSGKAMLGNRDAYRLLYTHRMGEITGKVLQFLMVDGDRAFVVTFTAAPDNYDNYKDHFENMAKSFQLKEKMEMAE